MSRIYGSLVSCILAVVVACVFGLAGAADKPAKKPVKKDPTPSNVVPPTNVVPNTVKKGTGTPGMMKKKPGDVQVVPQGTLPINPKLNPQLKLPKTVLPGTVPQVQGGNVLKKGQGTVSKPKITIHPGVNTQILGGKGNVVGPNPQRAPGVLKIKPKLDLNPQGKVGLNPQPEPPSQFLLGSKGALKLNPQPEPPGSHRLVLPGKISQADRGKLKPLVIPKNGLLPGGIVGPPYGDKTQNNADSGKVLQLKPEGTEADKVRGLIEADEQQAAKRQQEVLRGLFGAGKQKKGAVADILPLGVDDGKKSNDATILPLGVDDGKKSQGASIMQFKERDRMVQSLQTLKVSPELQAQLGLKHTNLDKISGLHQDRLSSLDQFAHWQKSEIGQNLSLLTQFQLQSQGDLTRRLNLTGNLLNAGGWIKSRQYGILAPNYTTSAYSSWYAGGGAYPTYCWSPHWSPWVDWCWWDTCPIFYDPRPYYCIPIVYDPCLPWVYYPYPIWHPLPVVVCGTWIDVAPVVVSSGQDVQLLAVRFVDNGHAEQNQGSRYRAWVRLNGPHQIATPFSVQLLASNEPIPTGELAQAGVVVPSMDIGETQVLDIRLPLAANTLGITPKGQRVPFKYLHVLVDSHQQIPEAFEDNNGFVLQRTDVLPVDPAAFSTDLTAATPNHLLSIAGEGFGPEPGQVIVAVGDQQVQAEIHGWYDLGVQFAVPNFDLTEPVEVEVLVVRGDGAASNPLTVQLAPEGWIAEDVSSVEQAPLPEAPVPESL